MGVNDTIAQLIEGVGHSPTEDQQGLIERLANYLHGAAKDIFVIRGYAGTGKTTLVSALVRLARLQRVGIHLMAPTGRAAKVMSAYSRKQALTLHKKLYRFETDASGNVRIKRAPNIRDHNWYIVDEASMIADRSGPGQFLLGDLIDYVFEGAGNKLILVGDVAQLPPVGSLLSPALVPRILRDEFSKRIDGYEMKQVVRQAEQSGILQLATELRHAIEEQRTDYQLTVPPQGDVVTCDTHEMLEYLEDTVSQLGEDAFAIVCLSNKSANRFNDAVRHRVLYRSESIESGDRLMVVKNNYFWLAESKTQNFIANGDLAVLERLGRSEELYGCSFTEASIALVDEAEPIHLDAKLNLEVLRSDGPSMPPDQLEKVYQQVWEAYDEEEVPSRQKRMREDPHWNALYVKFAYAITGHKAQGGQWPVVFVDASFLQYKPLSVELLRWLYTAVTRASERVYLVNWPDSMRASE